MELVENKYGIAKKGTTDLLRVSVYSDDEYCLENFGEWEWLTDDYSTALTVIHGSSLKALSSAQKPWHNYKPETLEVVEVKRVITKTTVKQDIIKLNINSEFQSEYEIPCFAKKSNKNIFKNISFIKDKIWYAIEVDDKYLVFYVEDAFWDYYEQPLFDKKYFDIIN